MRSLPALSYSQDFDTPYGKAIFKVFKDPKWNGQAWLTFHGAGQNDDSLARNLYAHHQDGGGGAPVIISFSAGERWLLVHSKKSQFSLRDFFNTTIVPLVRQNIDPTSKVIGIGYSMGGANLLAAFMDNRDLFNELVFLNPAVIPLSPYADRNAIKAFSESAHLPFASRLKSYLGLVAHYPVEPILVRNRDYFSDSTDWLNNNPLFVFERMVASTDLSDKRVFIASGVDDVYGFRVGAVRLEKAMQEMHAPVVTVAHHQGHLHIPYCQLNEFLNHR